jgi:hypothetical protein
MPARRFVNVLVRGMPRTPILCRIGTPRSAAVRVSTAEPDVVSACALMARMNPTFARFNSIRIGANGESDPSDLPLAWAGARAIRLMPD